MRKQLAEIWGKLNYSQHTGLDNFQKRTSVYIDPFGNTRIYGDHVNIIVEIVKKYKLNLEAKKDRLLLQTVMKFKDSLLDTNDGLLIIGD